MDLGKGGWRFGNCVQAGSCPASPGALGWSFTDLPGASFEKGIEIEEALLER